MNLNRIALAAGIALALNTTTLLAAPFNSFDPRSMAMGGAGVAVGNAVTAPFFNPALLAAAQKDDDFAIAVPVGARYYDPEDLEGSVNDFNDADYVGQADALYVQAEQAYGNLITDPSDPAVPQTYREAANLTDDLNLALAGLSDKPVSGEAGAGLIITVPGDTFGLAVVGSGWVAAAGVFNYEDQNDLETLSNDLDAFAQCIEDNQAALAGDPTATPCDPATLDLVYIDETTGDILYDPNTDVQSTADVRAIGLTEVGLSVAYEAPWFAIGFTPKLQQVTTIDVHATAQDYEDIDPTDEQYRKEYEDMNIDLGIAKQLDGRWRVGVVGKNLIAKEYDTARKDEPDYLGPIKLNPQYRAGISYQGSLLTLAVDADLVENDPVGFEDGTQYVSTGLELNLLKTLQLRGGYRANLPDSERDVASLGVGVSIIGIHLDAAVAGNSNEVGAAAQLSVQF